MSKSLHTIAHSLTQPDQDVPDIGISGVKVNSTQVEKGDLFIAISGTKVDGHDYIHDAIDAGAGAIISNGRDVGDLPVPQIKVANPRRAASIVAAEYYEHPTKDMTVIGITGTNGKTTTAFLVQSILKTANIQSAQFGTLGLIADGFEQEASLTTPDAIVLQKQFSDLKDKGFSHIVMEVSSHALDQYRVADVDFNIGVFTNLTPEHLDYHATLESYYHAKAKLFRMLDLDATAILNGSDPYGERMAEESHATQLIYSRKNGNSIHFSEVMFSIHGIKGTIVAGKQEYNIVSKLIGEFNVENILAAVSVAHALGIEKSVIEQAIEECACIPGRMETFQLQSQAMAIVDYAHTPDAYEKVLGTVKHLTPSSRKLFVVFGAGGNRDKSKRPEMARITEMFASHCFITPDNPRSEDPDQISKEVISGFTTDAYTVYADREKGLRDALAQSSKNDIVVVLGKGREEYQEISGQKEIYSDLKIIRDYQ